MIVKIFAKIGIIFVSKDQLEECPNKGSLNLNASVNTLNTSFRRDLINEEVNNLRNLLSLSSGFNLKPMFQLQVMFLILFSKLKTTTIIKEIQVMALSCAYIRKNTYFPVSRRLSSSPSPESGVDVFTLLDGFILVLYNGAKILVAENTMNFLGVSPVIFNILFAREWICS